MNPKIKKGKRREGGRGSKKDKDGKKSINKNKIEMYLMTAFLKLLQSSYDGQHYHAAIKTRIKAVFM